MNEYGLQTSEDRCEHFERCFLVALRHKQETPETVEELGAELEELMRTLDIEVVGATTANLFKPRPRYLMGSGKAEEITRQAKECDAEAIVIDDPLSPSQQRNWEQLAGMPVLDREEIILDIFGRRARTREAELQIALARAEYDLPRLKRRWTHLSRQRGGTSGSVGLRGRGEQQIEEDYRLVNNRITKLKKELEEVRKQRSVQRKQRQGSDIQTAALVGYTNAGKSSLLNALSKEADAFTEDKLFATLDPAVRRIQLPGNQELLLSDTVGFIRKLPHTLIEAFKATLEEAAYADFIIEVLDVTNPQVQQHHETTDDVLGELGAADKKRLIVFNKVDLVDNNYTIPRLRRRFGEPLFVSAKSGRGLEQLRSQLTEELQSELKEVELMIPHEKYDVVAFLHRTTNIRKEESLEQGVRLQAVMPPKTAVKLAKYTI
ncbi:MAG: GTPase HflX [Verrucomicrobiota bacterium]